MSGDLKERMVRIHRVLTPDFYPTGRPSARPDAIVIPKVNGPAEIQLAAEIVSAAEPLHQIPVGTTALLAIIETAKGLLQAFDIASVSPRLKGLIFGHADLAMTLDVQERMALDGIVRYARQQLVIAARAAGRDAYDMTFLQVDDLDGLYREALEGRHMGYAGKLVIHPTHIEPVNEVYTPSNEEVVFALRVLDGYKPALREGQAVFTVDGRMIDVPIVDVERRILERARRAGTLPVEAQSSG